MDLKDTLAPRHNHCEPREQLIKSKRMEMSFHHMMVVRNVDSLLSNTRFMQFGI